MPGLIFFILFFIKYSIINRDVGTKFQSLESLSHLIASVLILQEPKTAENRKLSWENDFRGISVN
jgi:hypothetical protein